MHLKRQPFFRSARNDTNTVVKGTLPYSMDPDAYQQMLNDYVRLIDNVRNLQPGSEVSQQAIDELLLVCLRDYITHVMRARVDKFPDGDLTLWENRSLPESNWPLQTKISYLINYQGKNARNISVEEQRLSKKLCRVLGEMSPNIPEEISVAMSLVSQDGVDLDG